ncbi:TPA: peptidylprolyl isomerase [Candidatus Micrarchaeota archaeon]|nr:peptidylprolyl isomerase [Candidatus Micrarchaeota archaeon]
MKNLVLLFAIAIAFLVAGCASQSPPQQSYSTASPTVTAEGVSLAAKAGDIVSVDYVGTFDDGKVFDTSIQAEAQKAGLPARPSYEQLEFTVGAGQVIKGFEDAAVGMAEGEEKTVHIEAKNAYGERRDDLVLQVPRSNFDANATIRVGSKIQAGNGMVGTITGVSDANVTVDFNPEMAGKALNFKVIMRKITRR